MMPIGWQIVKALFGLLASLRLKRCVYCEFCEDCKAFYKIPGPTGHPLNVCKHCIKQKNTAGPFAP
jgi:hypothetical protein